MSDLTNVTTGEVRLSFVHLFKPYAAQPGQEEKFSVTCLLPKTDVATKQRIDAAIAAARDKGIKDKWNGIAPPNLPTPIHDGDGVRPDGTPFGPECKGHWVFTAYSKADRPVEVVDMNRNPIINQSEIYSGVYGQVNFNAFPYFAAGKKGIGFGLGPVRKTRDGEVLGGGRVTAAQAFGGAMLDVQNVPAAQAALQNFTVDPISGLPLNG